MVRARLFPIALFVALGWMVIRYSGVDELGFPSGAALLMMALIVVEEVALANEREAERKELP